MPRSLTMDMRVTCHTVLPHYFCSRNSSLRRAIIRPKRLLSMNRHCRAPSLFESALRPLTTCINIDKPGYNLGGHLRPRSLLHYIYCSTSEYVHVASSHLSNNSMYKPLHTTKDSKFLRLNILKPLLSPSPTRPVLSSITRHVLKVAR